MTGSGFWTALVTVLTAIVGLAVVATLVSRNAQTPQVIGSFWSGFSGALGAATGPVMSAGRFSGLGNDLVMPGMGYGQL